MFSFTSSKTDPSFEGIKAVIASGEAKYIASGAFGNVYLDEKHSTAIKEIDITQEKLKQVNMTKSALLDSLFQEAKLNSIVHGVGSLILNSDRTKAYMILKKLPRSFQKQDSTPEFRMKYYSTREEFLNLFLNITKVVNDLHTKHKLVHNDLHIGNILINGDGSVELCDFGTCRPIGELVGEITTAKHHAPELKNAKSITAHPSQDIYTLGWILWNGTNAHRFGCSEHDSFAKSLGESMMNSDPKARPALHEVIAAIEDNLQHRKESEHAKSPML